MLRSCSQPEYTAITIAGPPDSSAEEQWVKLKEHPDVLAAAPDDEVLAELLATQVIIKYAYQVECAIL